MSTLDRPGIRRLHRRTGHIHSLSPPELRDISRQNLLDYFDNAWDLTEVLFSALRSDEAFYRQPSHRLRHPLIFYYGHAAVLYVNKLRLAGLISSPLHPEYERLFETGVDEMSWDDLSQKREDWPAVESVRHYRSRVYELVRGIIQSSPDLDTRDMQPRCGGAWAILLAIEHERIHFETSSVLIRELPEELVERPEAWPEYSAFDEPSDTPGARANPMIAMPTGVACIGKPPDHPSFGWDNEYGSRTISVAPFRASRSLVSNGEYWHFVAAGAYSEPRYWSTEGWQWRSFRNAKWPTFWAPNGPAGLHQYRLRLSFETVPMQWSRPVIVNFHEAKAYCAWKGEQEPGAAPYRLLTEAEHHRLRGNRTAKAPNRNLAYGSEGSTDEGPAGSNEFHDVFGNLWQWCEDHIAALPAFAIDPLYEDFSTPCFDGRHNLIMGGSFASTGGETSPWARFHFRRHFFQHVGFRLAQSVHPAGNPETTCEDAPPPHAGDGPCCSRKRPNRYESQEGLGQYLLLHYGSREETSGNSLLPENCFDFPRRCADLLREAAQQAGVRTGRALDLGCAVGRASFELARDFRQVRGIDLSANFIDAANALREHGRLEY